MSSAPGSSCQVAFSERSSEKDKGVPRVSEGVGVQPARMLKAEASGALAQTPGSPLLCIVLLEVNNKRDSAPTEISAENLPRSAEG